MISFKYPNGPYTLLWQAYVDAGWAKDGFKGFTSRLIPYATVEGTTQKGLILHFDNEEDFIAFKLGWL